MPVQFRDLSVVKTPKQSFTDDIQFLTVAVCSAAGASKDFSLKTSETRLATIPA